MTRRRRRRGSGVVTGEASRPGVVVATGAPQPARVNTAPTMTANPHNAARDPPAHAAAVLASSAWPGMLLFVALCNRTSEINRYAAAAMMANAHIPTNSFCHQVVNSAPNTEKSGSKPENGLVIRRVLGLSIDGEVGDGGRGQPGPRHP